MKPEERFFALVEHASDGCWLWTGHVVKGGYAAFWHGSRRVAAHRWAYERWVGPIPADHQLDHTCHNEDAACTGGDGCRHRRCVNPEHVEPVTAQENTRRARSRITHCPHGHAYSDVGYVDGRGKRVCRSCRDERNRARSRAKST